MKKTRSGNIHLFELDGRIHHFDGSQLTPVEGLNAVAGDRWLVTDFREGVGRFMTVEAPVRYAELLVRKKLQESGEFEEPVEILTHWKKKRGKNSTDIFFTAVPTRLARLYREELRAGSHITLVFAMYGVLWEVLRRMRAKCPAAVVLRHDRFAEIVIGSHNQVYFANRCVAFDTQPEQIQALWESVRTDIETVEKEHGISVDKVLCLTWKDAGEAPSWPEAWQTRLVFHQAARLAVEGGMQAISWPEGIRHLTAIHSVSPPAEIALYAAQRFAPAANLVLLVLLVLLAAGWSVYGSRTRVLETQLAGVQHQIGQVRLETPGTQDHKQFTEQLGFIQTMAQWRRQPSYRQVLDDLTPSGFEGLRVSLLKLDYAPELLRVELYGDIAAPFDQAHDHYKRYLRRLQRQGYHVDESRFETQISTSQLVLKLSRPVT